MTYHAQQPRQVPGSTRRTLDAWLPDVGEKLPSVTVCGDIEMWEWVIDHLPKHDGITKAIQSACQHAVHCTFPNVFMPE